MLYCDEVLEFCKNAAGISFSTKTIARKLNLSRKVVRASLTYVNKYVDNKLVLKKINPEMDSKKGLYWSYV